MYIALYIFLIVLYFILYKKGYGNSTKKKYIVIVTLVLSLVSAIRHDAVGVDTYAYYLSFMEAKEVPWSDIWYNLISFFQGSIIKDPGYALFVKVAGIIFHDFHVYLFFVALFFLSALGYILYKSVDQLFGYVISYSFYISLLYTFFPNSAIRQTIAMSFLLWAIIIFLSKNRKLIPLIFLIFAFLLHKSVLFGVIPVFVYYFKNTKLVYRSALLFMPLFFAVSFEFVELLVLLSDAEHYLQYIEGDGGSSVVFIVEMVFFYLIGFASMKYVNHYPLYRRFAFIAFALAISIISFMRVDPSLQRLIAYFSIWGMVFLPNALYVHRGTVRNILIVCVLALCIGRSVLTPTPYKFYWQHMELHERYDGM
jgi:transmembrane protein EpsG